MTTIFAPIREFFKKGDLLLLFLCLLASGYGLVLIYSATRTHASGPLHSDSHFILFCFSLFPDKHDFSCYRLFRKLNSMCEVVNTHIEEFNLSQEALDHIFPQYDLI